jgi:hypothetical protein
MPKKKEETKRHLVITQRTPHVEKPKKMRWGGNKKKIKSRK